MPKCPFCGSPNASRTDLTKHVQVFHPNLTEEERLKRIKEHPIAFLKERGFQKELELIKQGRCPVCSQTVREEGLHGSREWKEWQISGLCGPCQRKRAEGRL